VVDYASRWTDFKELQNTTTSPEAIKALSEMFATHGVPSVVVSDNGPQYSSYEFQRFAEDWGFKHVTSSPRYPQANGAAERAVQTAKNIIRKNENPYLGLLAYRTAPIHNGQTPSQILMSRLLRTDLPTAENKLTPELTDQDQFNRKEEEYKNRYTENYNRKHRTIELPSLSPGDKVFVRDQKKHGEVVEKLLSPRSYRVSMGNGNVVRRNRRSLIHSGIDKETDPETLASTQPSPSPPPTIHKSPPPAPQNTVAETPTPSLMPGTDISVTRSGRTIKSTQNPDMVYYK
jgi:hypothetical protein